MLKHIKSRHLKIKKSCDLCEFTYYHQGSLNAHMRNFHQIEKLEENALKVIELDEKEEDLKIKSFSCQHCDAVIVNKSKLLMEHSFTCLGVERPNQDFMFQCFSCSYHTRREKFMLRHIRLHTGAKPFGCPKCSFRAPREDQVVSHIRNRHQMAAQVHKPVKKQSEEPIITHFTCKHCECEIPNVFEDLLEHTQDCYCVERSDPNYKYVCFEGDYHTRREIFMARHILVHTGEKIHKCPHCDHKTAREESMQSHVKRMHPGRIQPKQTIVIYNKKGEIVLRR